MTWNTAIERAMSIRNYPLVVWKLSGVFR